jgi:hypothetical protein
VFRQQTGNVIAKAEAPERKFYPNWMESRRHLKVAQQVSTASYFEKPTDACSQDHQCNGPCKSGPDSSVAPKS